MKIVRGWRSRKNLLVPSLLLVNSLIVLVVLTRLPHKQSAWRFITAGIPKPTASTEPPAGPIVRVDEVLVKLRAGDRDRYVGAAFDLEIGNEKDKDTVNNSMPRIRDAMLSMLSDTSPEDLQGSDRLQALKRKMLERLETLVPGRRLKAIYITNLVMQ